MRIKAYLARHAVGLSFVAVLLMDYIVHNPGGFSGWAATWYALDYSLGAGSRLLVGSVLDFLCGGMVTEHAAVVFASAASVALIALTAVLVDNLYRSAPARAKKGALLLIALFAAAPFSIRYLWNEANFGRLDLYLYALTVFGLIAALRLKNPILRAGLIAIVSITALLVHQVYAFIFFPVLFALLCMDAFTGEKITLARLAPGLCCCVLVVGVFFYVQLFSKLNAPTVEELTAILSAKTNLDVSHSALDYEYYHDFLYGFYNHTLPFLSGGRPVKLLAATLMLLVPAIAVFAFLWSAMLKRLRADNKRVWRCPQPYMLLSLLCFLPPFILMVDWSRWLAALFGAQTLMLLTLLARGDAAAEEAFSKLSASVEKNAAPYLFLIVYTALLSSFRAREFLPEAEALLQAVSGLFR